jgi:hypothetical protein
MIREIRVQFFYSKQVEYNSENFNTNLEVLWLLLPFSKQSFAFFGP